jgi:hypothetical protein
MVKILLSGLLKAAFLYSFVLSLYDSKGYKKTRPVDYDLIVSLLKFFLLHSLAQKICILLRTMEQEKQQLLCKDCMELDTRMVRLPMSYVS